ncbi:uroporphyrinogen-III C-methyltransferase [Aquabacterium sp.]|uniref:uroporphyrinogen-III C-methyltransferase n=1 Tax=Aquabacterium sp. TaxID=1872578 RepID=UPI0025C40FD1|nr:uroporphyrinogen-III C-methyltransferase [Aquabacterium sp.]
MSELPSPISAVPLAHEASAQAPEATPDAFLQQGPGWVRLAVIVLSLAAGGAGWLAWQTHKRVQGLEQELVRRQQDSQGQATEARVAARQAQELAREAAARVTLLDTRLSEVALQRSQVEDLIKTLNVSRDENLVYDLEAGLRVASQQAALTGSAEPLITALQSADERLTRAKEPRLDNVRRAVAKDLDRVRATRVADINALTIRLDEAVRLVDEIPLINQPEAAGKLPPTAPSQASKGKANRNASGPGNGISGVEPSDDSWRNTVLSWTRGAAESVWSETRSLVRVTRIAQPEGMLIAPDQAFFLRENVKLRLLNARLALLSRQTTQAAADLRLVERTLPRYFEAQSRKTQLLQSMVSDVIAQSQQTAVPRPDDTLAALAAVAGGR